MDGRVGARTGGGVQGGLVGCRDVKMSRLVGGHLIDRKMSYCQDTKISTPCISAYDVKMSKMPCFHPGVLGVVRCQAVKVSRCPGHAAPA